MSRRFVSTPNLSRRPRTALLACAVTAAIPGVASHVSAANTPVSLTGWNQDLIAENTNGLTSTSSPFDVQNNYVFYENGVIAGGAGLPVSGSFTSASNSSTTFQFQPYTANNALFFNSQNTANGAVLNTTGTLTLAATSAFTSLAFLGAAANGTSTFNYVLNFSNGQSLPETMTIGDWFNGTPYAIEGFGREERLNPLSGGDNTTSGSPNPRMYEIDLTIPAADQTYGLSSISFTQTAGNTAAIFAVSGAVSASTVYFSGAVNGNFDTSTANFLTGDGTGSALAFANSNAAVFDDTAQTGNVTVASGGVQPFSLTFNNNSKAYTFSGGAITGSGGGAFFNGSSSVTFNDAVAFPGGTTLNAGTVVIGSAGSLNTSSVNIASGATLNYSTGATAPGTFALIGSGTVNVRGTALTVGGATSFNGSFGGTGGSLNISAGTVEMNNNVSAAAFSNGITVGSGGALMVGDNDPVLGMAGGSPITLQIAGVGSALQNVSNGTQVGALISVPGSTNAFFAGKVVLNGAATISAGSNGVFTVSGPISGTGNLTLGGNTNSTEILAGNNTYTGNTIVTPEPINAPSQSNVLLGSNGGFSPNGGLVVGNGNGFTHVDLNGFSPTVAFLSGPASTVTELTNSGSVPSTLNINGGNNGTSPATFATNIADNGGSSTLAIFKTGTGNQILSGTSTYTGGTNISAGTLTASTGRALGSGNVILSGGTLALNGLVNITSNGTAAFTKLNHAGNFTPTNDGTTLTLTQQGTNSDAASAFIPITISDAATFTASFTLNHTTGTVAAGGVGDGITYGFQNQSASALGGNGGGVGYSSANGGTAITPSQVGYFEIYNYGQFGTGRNGTLTLNATQDNTILTTSGQTVTVSYNGPAQLFTASFVTGGTTYTQTSAVDLVSLFGGSAGGSTTGYFGFTAATGGGGTATLAITNLTYQSTAAGPTQIANPVIAAAGTASVIQSSVATGFTSPAIGPLTLNPGSTVRLTAAGTLSAPRMVLQTPSITFTPVNGGTAFTGKLDLVTNDLDVTNSSLGTVSAYVATGYNLKGGANWAGPGITSSAAAANTTHLTALGVISNNGNGGSQLYGSGTTLGLFDGANPGGNDVLVKYTYFGDANLDGKVDGSDYSLIDAGYNSNGSLTGWYNGDFNYDGVIDGSDYALIDNAFNNQGSAENVSSTALVAASTDQVAGTAAVPEPASLGLIAAGMTALLARRRRA
jgi:fibronectin-binding autotransporter adhesin